MKILSMTFSSTLMQLKKLRTVLVNPMNDLPSLDFNYEYDSSML